MKCINIAENLMRLRHERGVTQEVVADFLGVTKASVSKWETGVSLPDVVQLPRLASYYGVSIDALMGYEARIDMKQIREYYRSFAEAFSKQPFHEVMEKVRDFIRQYYACSPAILQMVVLLMNHYMMAESEQQPGILEEMIDLCIHVQKKSKDVNLCTEAMIYQASIEMMRGNPQAAIEKLEPYQDMQGRKESAEPVLIQSYQMLGMTEQATEKNQVYIYTHLLGIVGNSIFYIMSNLQNKDVVIPTIERIEKLAEAYELDRLHPNIYLQFVYAKALFYATNGMEKEALEHLTVFVKEAVDFITNTDCLHGDAYFDRLDDYLKKMDSLNILPRNPKTVLASIGQNLQHPAFACLHDRPEFQNLLHWKELQV